MNSVRREDGSLDVSLALLNALLFNGAFFLVLMVLALQSQVRL